jgi:hypothetical protein
MPYLPGKLPYRGWITDSPYSAVPDGYTSDLLNIMPADPFRRRVRLGTRPASSRVYQFGSGQNIQCMIRTIAFNNATTPPTRKDRVIIVAGGKFYYLDPQAVAPVQITNVPAGNPNTAAVLSATASRIEGVQRGRYAYFVDGNSPNGYVKVDLQSASLQITYWHHGSHGPEDQVVNGSYAATLINSFGSRIALAGVKGLENIWYFSNVADPDDWNPSSGNTDDAQAGTSGTIGPVGDEIVAMSPLGTAGFLLAGKRSLAYLTADPVYDSGARIATLSKTVGVVGPRAICEGPEKSLYLLGQDGLYRVRPNDFDVDRGALVSLNKLDSFFSGLRYEYLNPVLHYDVERRGVWIFLTRTDSPKNSTHLFYSEQVDGFFPIRLYDPSFLGAETVCQSGTADGRNQIMLCAYKNTISFFDQRLSSGCDGFPGSGYSASGPSTVEEKTAQLVDNRLSIGPIQPPQPTLVLAKELQVELAADDYLVPVSLQDNNVSIAERPKVVMLSAETPQEAIGENLNSLTVEDVLVVSYDGGDRTEPSDSLNSSGGATTPAWTGYADGGYCRSVNGVYTAQDALQSPLERQYYTADGVYLIQREAFLPVSAGSFVVGNYYKITTVGTTTWTSIGAADNNIGTEFQATGVGSGTGVAEEIAWVIKRAEDAAVNQDTSAEIVVFKQTGTPLSDEVQNGDYSYIVYDAGTPKVRNTETVDIRISTFAAADITDFGYLREGINNRMRCRIRAGAMYVRIGSTGWPWAIERVAVEADPISRRRTVVDVGATDISESA